MKIWNENGFNGAVTCIFWDREAPDLSARTGAIFESTQKRLSAALQPQQDSLQKVVAKLGFALDILVLIFPYLDAKSFLALCSTCTALQQPSIRLDPTYWSHQTRSTFLAYHLSAAYIAKTSLSNDHEKIVARLLSMSRRRISCPSIGLGYFFLRHRPD